MRSSFHDVSFFLLVILGFTLSLHGETRARGRGPSVSSGDKYATLEEVGAKPDDGVQSDAKGFDYHLALADKELGLGNTEAAIRHLQSAMELKPTNTMVRSKLAQIYWSQGR